MTATTDLPRLRFTRVYQRSSKTAESRGVIDHRHSPGKAAALHRGRHSGV
jgi:hypothetical protein